MSGGTRGRSFTGLFAPPKCAASGRVIQTGCQLWMIKIIGRLTRPCSGWPLPFTAHSPRGSAWCSTSRKAETMLGRSFSGKTARGPRRRGACGKGRRSTCPRFLACYSNTNKDCIERYERGEVKRRFSTQPRRVGTLRGDPRPAARCGERDVFRSNDDEYKQARLLSKSHHHYSPRAAKLNNARRAELPRGTASSAMVSPRPTSGGGGGTAFLSGPRRTHGYSAPSPLLSSFVSGETCTGEKVTIAGASGYIGKAVVRESVRRGYSTKAVKLYIVITSEMTNVSP